MSRLLPIAVSLWLTSVAGAADPAFTAVLGGAGQDYAASVATDSRGNTYLAGLTYSPDFPVTSGALQTKAGGGSDAFVAKFDRDGHVVWSTYLGGAGDDWATGVAVDSAGNVVVAGWTRSPDFPVAHPLQGAVNAGVSPFRYDAFITKLNPAGSQLLYSTYLGGSDDDGAVGLALDSSGNAYVVGSTLVAKGFTGFPTLASGFGAFVSKVNAQGALVYSFFHPNVSFAGIARAGIAVDATGAVYVTGTSSSTYPLDGVTTIGSAGRTQALVFKLAPDGSHLQFETELGGSEDAHGMSIAVDRTGAIYIGGITSSIDFPLVNAYQSSLGARPLWKSGDRGVTWAPIDDLPFAFLQALAIDPVNAKVLYGATNDLGIFKSLDGGVTWRQANDGIASTQLASIVIAPLQPQILLAATAAGAIYRSTDGAAHWTLVDSAKVTGTFQVAIDGQNPNILYWSGGGTTRKSTDQGDIWTDVSLPESTIQSLAVDPRKSGMLYAYSNPIFRGKTDVTPSFIYRSSDGGATWTKVTSPAPAQGGLTLDASTDPATVFNGLTSRSMDGGATWTAMKVLNATAVGVDSAGTLYASVYNSGIFTSHDHGDTWTQISSPTFVNSNLDIVPAPAAAGTLYAIVTNNQTSGFITKLSPDGKSIVFSTFLNGHVSMDQVISYAAEPPVFLTQNWISAIAMDRAGNVVVGGATRSTDFLGTSAGHADAFTAIFSPDGRQMLSATRLGGSGDESVLAVAIDGLGGLIVAGQTWSLDFLGAGTTLRSPVGLGEAFVRKLPLARFTGFRNPIMLE